jgi:hypothetical protein
MRLFPIFLRRRPSTRIMARRTGPLQARHRPSSSENRCRLLIANSPCDHSPCGR